MTPTHATNVRPEGMTGPQAGSAVRHCLTVVAVLLAWLAIVSPVQAEVTPQRAQALLQALDTDDFDAKAEAARAIAASDAAQKTRWLEALLDGRLGRERRGERFYIITDDSGREWPIIDAITFEEAGTGSRRSVDAFRINNALRTQLQGLIASLSLDEGDEATRLEAAKRLIGEVDAQSVDAVATQLDNEESPEVRAELETALALYRVEQGDAAALETLRGDLDTRVRNSLATIAASDAPIAAAAGETLAGIEGKRAWYECGQTLFFGLSAGSVLVLAAIGLAITFGVMGVINMAHGELIMIGAYTTYVMQLLLPNHIGLALVLAVPTAFCVSGLVGVAIERGIVRFLYGRPLETLLATFGLSLVLQQLVRSIFSPLNRSVASPEWMQGLWQINDLFAVTYNRLFIILFTLAVFAILLAVLNRTSLGLKVRAVSQNRAMARALGVRTARVDAMTFGLGSGIAGIAGVALSQLTNVGPNLGQAYIVDSFMVVVFGGVGNLWGTLIGGLSLGVLNKLLEPAAGAVMAKILVLVGLILFIQRRPRGLFPQKGRAAEGH